MTNEPFTSLDAARLQLNFSARACIVTGGAQGIGLAIARAFAAHGATLVIADLSGGQAEEAARNIRDSGGHASAVCLDVADEDSVRGLVERSERELGAIDIVIHNAAFFPLRPFEAIDSALLDHTLAVNLKAAFWLAQTATPALARSGHGRVLVTSSVTGPRVAYPGLAHYAASKAALNGFVRAAALELAKYRITVNGVEPGMIATSAVSNLDSARRIRDLAHGIPLRTLGQPQDIAHATLFLASDGASYITGQTIVVDGGALLPECRLHDDEA